MSIFNPNPLPTLREMLQRMLDTRKGTSDEPVVTQLSGSNAQLGSRVEYTRTQNGELAAGAEDVVLDTTEPCYIELLQWACNRDHSQQLVIARYVNGSQQSIGELKLDGSSSHGFYPNQIRNNKSGRWELLEYDATNHRYKMQLREGLNCPQGVRITRRNLDSVTRNNAVLLEVRYY